MKKKILITILTICIIGGISFFVFNKENSKSSGTDYIKINNKNNENIKENKEGNVGNNNSSVTEKEKGEIENIKNSKEQNSSNLTMPTEEIITNIKKVENNKVYLTNNDVIDLSQYKQYSKVNINNIKDINSITLVFFTDKVGSNVYVYTGAVKESINKNNVKGTQVTGMILSATETNIQLDKDTVYELSSSVSIVDNTNANLSMPSALSSLKRNKLVTFLVVDNKVVSIKLIN